MNGIIARLQQLPGRRPVAAAVASLFAFGTPAAALAANTWPVSNCNESGPGSLRAVIGAGTTLSDDTVDMSGLACSIVSLTTGEIVVLQNTLSIKGPGAQALTIDGSQLYSGPSGPVDSRVFTHRGTGTLSLAGLSVTGGHSYHVSTGYPALGGCVYSAGNVSLYMTRLSSCSATSQGDRSAGGAIYAKGNVTAKYSVISGNTVFAGKSAKGGGVRAVGLIKTKYSTIESNTVSSSLVDGSDSNTFKYAAGGGLSAYHGVNLIHSTISNNASNGSFGGVDASADLGDAGATSILLSSSTISGNSADQLVGGIYANTGTVGIYNSTIAFNTAQKGRIGTSPDFNFFGPGLALSTTVGHDVAVTLQSSLLSNNTYGGAEFDLTTAYDSSNPAESNVTFNASPANNLVRTSLTTNDLPADTLRFSCPLLGTLRDNGGVTKTHALLSGSPAIDAGNNSKNQPEDQRGGFNDAAPYPYPRVSHVVADIGAFEVDQADTIFDSEFEGCPILF